MEHSRTCIGYNDSSLIFADNWGMNWYETSNNPYNDNYSAGFSTIDKWAIYTWVRDLVYVDEAGKPRARAPSPKRKPSGAARRTPSPKRKPSGAARRAPSPKRKPSGAARRVSSPKRKPSGAARRAPSPKRKQQSGRAVHNPCQPGWGWNECRKNKCSYDKTLPAGQKCHS